MKFLYIIMTSCLSLMLISCHAKDGHAGHNHDHDHDHSHGDEKPVVESHDHEDEIVFTKDQAAKVGLELYTVKPETFYQIIKTSGQVLSAQGDESTISATTSGIVSFNKTSLNEGVAVRAGETLLSISSRNIVDGDPVQKAKSAYTIAKREYDRAKELIKDKLISETEYNDAKLNFNNAEAAYGSFANKQTSKGSAISSPISGFLKTKLVAEGEFVNVGQALAVVTQSKKLRLSADVSERYYSSLSNIVSANFKTPYDDKVYELSQLNGRKIAYARSVSAEEYSLPVSFEFDNVGNIVAGAYVDVYLHGAMRNDLITVPIGSLLEDQGIFFVFKQLDAEGYEKIEVKLGASDGKRVEVLSGLTIGDIVVSKSAMHVHLAGSAGTLPHAHEH